MKMTTICLAMSLMGCTGSAFGQIPAEAFRDVHKLYTLRDKLEPALIRPHEDQLGAFVRGPNMHTFFEWIPVPVDKQPYQLHEIILDVDKDKKVVKKVSKEAIVYDLTGKDPHVYYRVPDKRWSALWTDEQFKGQDANGLHFEFRFCRPAEGPFKGWFLSFEDKPIQVPGWFGKKTDFLPAVLTKKVTPGSQIHFDGGHHSGVAP